MKGIFNLFGTKSKLGIDIGTSSIKVVELGRDGRHLKLLNYGIFELKSFNDQSGKSFGPSQSILRLPDQEIIWGLKELIKAADMKSRDVVASIPSFSTFATVFEIPYLPEQDLAKAIPFEAKKYVPLPLDEVVIDWSIVGVKNQEITVPENKTEPKNENKANTPMAMIEVFIAAVPKSETTRYQNIMAGAGLNLKALELENSSLIRGLLGNDLNSAAIINIGGRSTSILIVDKGYERISHNYEIGGFEITKSIARSLNVNIEKAEDLKRQFGMKDVDENIVNEAMISLIDMMAFETLKTIKNYEESKDEKVGSIILSGGLANMPNFEKYFSDKLGRPVIKSNVFSRIIYNQDLSPVIDEVGNIFPVAAGLAMRDI